MRDGLLQVHAGGAGIAIGALIADRSLVTDGTLIASRSLVAIGALIADRSLVADGALIADRSLVADGALIADRPLVTDGTLIADRSLVTRGALVSGRAFVAIRALGPCQRRTGAAEYAVGIGDQPVAAAGQVADLDIADHMQRRGGIPGADADRIVLQGQGIAGIARRDAEWQALAAALVTDEEIGFIGPHVPGVGHITAASDLLEADGRGVVVDHVQGLLRCVGADADIARGWKGIDPQRQRLHAGHQRGQRGDHGRAAGLLAAARRLAVLISGGSLLAGARTGRVGGRARFGGGLAVAGQCQQQGQGETGVQWLHG